MSTDNPKEKQRVPLLKHEITDHAVVDLFELIASQKWQRLKVFIFLHKSIVKTCSRGDCFPLHYVCKFHPPLGIVKCLWSAYPKAVFRRDSKGRHVLHIACKYRCSLEVIDFLLKEYPEAARKPDVKRCTPFLLLFKSSSSIWENDLLQSNEPRKTKEMRTIVMKLVRAAPFSTIMQDYTGMTALEYAIDKETDMSTIKLVQELTCEIQSKSRRHVLAL